MAKKVKLNKTQKAGNELNAGASLLAEGKLDDAIKAFKKSLLIDNKIVAAHFNLALAYLRKGDNLNSIDSLEETIKLKPDDFEAYNLLGHLNMIRGSVDFALDNFKRATALNPLISEAFYNLGVALMTKEKFTDAIKAYKKSLKLFPSNSIVLNNIGVTLEKLGKTEESISYYKKSLKINPQNAMALANIGAAIININPAEAASYFRKATEANPNLESAVYNYGVCLRVLGDTKGSIKQFEKAIALNPSFSPTYGQLYHQIRNVCDWKKADKMEKKMRNLTNNDIKNSQIPAETIFVSVVYDDNPKRNFDIARSWSQYIETKVAPYYKPYSFKKKPQGKIKIGYLSNDFRNHATSHLIMGMLKFHDRKKFDIYTYSYGENDKSFYRKEIEKRTIFRDITNLSHTDAADLIYKDKIDILVDLKGHTSNTRLEIPALRPAPIQANYLGFPGTSGASFFDYFIADKIVTPEKHRQFYSEQIAYLPHSYQMNDNQQKILKDKVSRKNFAIPDDHFVFCSFNLPYKIDKKVFDSWARILKAVPKSVICLLNKEDLEVENLSNEAKKRGINPNRLIFTLPLRKEVHLARLGLCDLALDTFICNGHTSTSDALWAGVPVVTLQGKHFASRVSSSLLSAIGLPELITKTPKEYEDLAIELATNPKKLSAIRNKLAANRLTHPLFDTELSTRNIEKAYIAMWDRYLNGEKPDTIVVKS